MTSCNQTTSFTFTIIDIVKYAIGYPGKTARPGHPGRPGRAGQGVYLYVSAPGRPGSPGAPGVCGPMGKDDVDGFPGEPGATEKPGPPQGDCLYGNEKNERYPMAEVDRLTEKSGYSSLPIVSGGVAMVESPKQPIVNVDGATENATLSLLIHTLFQSLRRQTEISSSDFFHEFVLPAG
ncbi:hypothetical protein Q1695_012487 [Nippostrongylus brasiliensis]|nr:hypothetical protein Q1695_012487 [Nippostrongylus brasiliensis]